MITNKHMIERGCDNYRSKLISVCIFFCVFHCFSVGFVILSFRSNGQPSVANEETGCS